MPSVIVIGAGVSGLTAARDLHAQGWDVTVVEARRRIGGRVDTVDLADVPVDMGGSWVHGVDGNPLVVELDRLGLAYFNDHTWEGGLGIHRDGWLDSIHHEASMRTRHNFDPTIAGHPGATMADAIDIYLANNPGPGSETARFVLEALEAPLNTGAAANDISAAGSARYELHPGGNLRVVRGYRMLVAELARDLDITLDTAVSKVTETAAGIEIETGKGNLAADAVVVSVPLSRLSRLQFDPELPSQHLGAINRLAMGSLEKIVFAFERRPWSVEAKRIIYQSDNQRFPIWIEMQDPPLVTVVAFYNPVIDEEIGAMTIEERVTTALDVLATLCDETPRPIAWKASNWLLDPWSLGSYSYFPTGSNPSDMDLLASPPTSRIVLAGEHTCAPYFGTVHGAFVSGGRAAAQLSSAHLAPS